MTFDFGRSVRLSILCTGLALGPAPGPALGAPVPTGDLRAAEDGADESAAGEPTEVVEPEITTNRDLPAPVARARRVLMDIARAGDVEGLAAIIEENGATPLFSFGGDADPIAFWRDASGDGEGREILAILLELLEAPPALMRPGTPDAFYAWPYFEALPLEGLSPAQEVELFTLVTAGDYEAMLEFGSYNFYRVHISPDGTWEAFVAGD